MTSETTESNATKASEDFGGLRMTKQRQVVYEVLTGNGLSHPTASEVFVSAKDRMPSISLATVYNCLESLTTAGRSAKSTSTARRPVIARTSNPTRTFTAPTATRCSTSASRAAPTPPRSGRSHPVAASRRCTSRCAASAGHVLSAARTRPPDRQFLKTDFLFS